MHQQQQHSTTLLRLFKKGSCLAGSHNYYSLKPKTTLTAVTPTSQSTAAEVPAECSRLLSISPKKNNYWPINLVQLSSWLCFYSFTLLFFCPFISSCFLAPLSSLSQFQNSPCPLNQPLTTQSLVTKAASSEVHHHLMMIQPLLDSTS